MDLNRYGQRFHHKAEDDRYKFDNELPEEKSVRAIFRWFGWGSERTSEFGVGVKWADVESLIQDFAQMNHPDAIKVQNALRLAALLEESGWRLEAPDSN
ncbi:MAG TPA: hypothetical protein VN838_15200 [Bradyrhizobium sp.]|nr:hypothetical protein [Bradyrhizobium sp.]